ncbi:YihY/virulence factor BrkB family protein [Pedobacter sp. HDW13]|uniref:YihY/virulence factor BrkB family protein n=1 Tax=unclassified Pedobacter TaxID=2628915 RepID=UPI000F5B3427|nr:MULTISPECIES: YihY/virulence factor BrkB family protein [unclassified Pedobacter]QIL38688.1 YihY/virulence factor BrkB family protein [Pedobacter sp. HDW13]RQO80150.1 ribonuclease BN [Pedobacter sp. KBW01]
MKRVRVIHKIKYFFVAIYHLFIAAGKGFMEDRVMKLSASLAYYTIFSLTPLIIIVLSAATLFFGDKMKTRDKFFIEVTELVGKPAATQIQGFVEHANKTGQSTLGLIIGIGTLIVGATAIFIEIQDSINLIWKVKAMPKKGWIKMLTNRLLSFSLIVSMGFLLLVSLVINSVVVGLGDKLVSLISESKVDDVIPVANDTMALIIYILNNALTLTAVTAVFTIIFKVLPDVNIKWKSAIIGALFTALLFSLGKYLIGIYIEKGSTVSAFGAAGSIIIILLWIYYTSIILYFGAEFTQAYAEKFDGGISPSKYAVFTKITIVEKKVDVLPPQHPEDTVNLPKE